MTPIYIAHSSGFSTNLKFLFDFVLSFAKFTDRLLSPSPMRKMSLNYANYSE